MAMMSTTAMVPVISSSIVRADDDQGEERMDWYAWLSKTGLDPALAFEYGLLFARNELEEEDIPHLDHEFLLSMGLSVAKHRLEILKLAKLEKRRRRPQRRPRPFARLLAAADKTRRCLARCLRSLAGGVGAGGGRAGSTALVPVRRSSFGLGGRQWAGGAAVVKGGKKLAALTQERLMLTDGSARATGTTPPPLPWYGRRGSGKGGGGDGKVRGDAGEVRWDSMFQDLKPT